MVLVFLGKGAPGKHGRRNQETESILKKSPGACPGSSRAPGRSAARVGLLESNRLRSFGPPREPGLRPSPRLELRLLLLGGIHRPILLFTFPEAGNPRSFRGATAGGSRGPRNQRFQKEALLGAPLEVSPRSRGVLVFLWERSTRQTRSQKSRNRIDTREGFAVYLVMPENVLQ